MPSSSSSAGPEFLYLHHPDISLRYDLNTDFETKKENKR
jgi:hypothetical protein